MNRLLNILAALLLTIVPALRPCDCQGFKFFCTCALVSGSHEAGEHASKAAASDDEEPACACCKPKAAHDEAAPDKTDAHKASKHAPALPTPRKPGDCAKFAAQELGQAAPIALASPVTTEPLAVVLWHSPRVLAECGRPEHAHFERPPPMGLIVARTRFLRI